MLSLFFPRDSFFFKGFFDVERIRDFCQSDFDTASGFVLDGYDKVFLWVGNEASRNVAVNTADFVKKFVDRVSSERNIGVEIEVWKLFPSLPFPSPFFPSPLSLSPPSLKGFFFLFQ